jgi:AraC-like DNA-binding protein
MSIVDETIQKQIQSLMEDGSQVLGLRLVFHDRLWRSGLCHEWRQHSQKVCTKNMAKDQTETCFSYCMKEVHRDLINNPETRIQTCPWGITEIAAPVYMGGVFAGILYAGPCWLEDGPVPENQEDVIVPPNRDWLKARQTMLTAIASQLGILLNGLPEHVPSDRRQRILDFIVNRLSDKISIEDMAVELDLSPSRVGHVVKELFDMTFPQLLKSVRLQEAAHLLTSTDRSIAEISEECGFNQQNYFSKQFTQMYELSPRDYRKQYISSI